MIKNNITVGIDIGTNTTRVVAIGFDKDTREPVTLAVGSSETNGMRLGYITNIDLVANSIKKAVKQVETTLGRRIYSAYVSFSGINLSSITSTGSVIISRADQEITHLDITKALTSSEEGLEILNKKIIHTLPVGYKLDGKDIYGRPEGMKGIKLETKTLFITCLKQNLEDIITALGLAKIEVIDIIASPIASSTILLNNKQKIAGCALVDIGAETVSVAVFENNTIISLQVFPIGSMDITKDIALGFKISLEEAESIKLGSVIGGDFPKKKIDEIIEARLGDIFELVENHLKRLRRNELLPAGIILTGGGSHINNIEAIARHQLKLPVRVGTADNSLYPKLKIRDSSWNTVYGLVLYGGDDEDGVNQEKSQFSDIIKQIKGFFKSIFSQLLP